MGHFAKWAFYSKPGFPTKTEIRIRQKKNIVIKQYIIFVDNSKFNQPVI